MQSTLRRLPAAAGLALASLLAVGCSTSAPQNDPQADAAAVAETTDDATETATTTPAANADSAPMTVPLTERTTEIATLGAGCYWCIEAVLEQIDGVESVVSGFMGGSVENPSYDQVCAGTTGHAEVVQVTFDPAVLPYEELLDWFWRLHDPTTLNRQGADVGTQYRSAIFTHSEAQAETARRSKEEAQPSFDDPIVTEITSASTFYVAPEYHQGFYGDNRSNGYCRAVIRPKLKKLGLQE